MISTARLPIENGVGTIGYTVYGSDLTVVAARSTASVSRLFGGTDWSIYGVDFTLPDGTESGVVIWDDDPSAPTAAAHDRFDLSDGTDGVLSVVRLPITDGVGTVGYKVYGDDNAVATAHSTADVVLLVQGDGWGIYGVVASKPSDVSRGRVLWDDANGNAAVDAFDYSGGGADPGGTVDDILAILTNPDYGNEALLAAIQAGGGGSSGGPVEQRTAAPDRILQVLSRGNGVYEVSGPVILRAHNGIGDRLLYAFDLNGTELASGAKVYGMQAPIVSGDQSSNLTVQAYGVGGTQVLVEPEIDPASLSTDDISLVLPINTTPTETLLLSAQVLVKN